jgi:signal transduction histidine kinase
VGTRLQVGERVIGVLHAGTHQARSFTEDDRRLLQIVAERAASAIERAQLYEKGRMDNERLKTLSRQLIEAQEAERRHLARELHDQIGGVFTAIKLNLQVIWRVAEAARPLVDDGIAIVDRAIQQVRQLSLELRPSMLDDIGLAAALRWYVDNQTQRAGLTAHLTLELPPERLPPELETACFRVVQEALTNVLRHAQAHEVWIDMRQVQGSLELVVRDDGVGFDLGAARERAARGTSLGLLGMQERVQLVQGELVIDSQPGRGTEVRARLPLAGLTAQQE